MSQIALYAGWYDWNASGPFAQPKVEFMPGAFAYHLQSYSAQTLRSTTNNWCGPLLAKGATATMGCVEEPYLEGTPNIALFFTRWLSGFSFGEAAYACQGPLSWQTTVIGDPLYRPFSVDLRTQHEALLASHSPWLEWSYLRLVNLNLRRGTTPAKIIDNLQETDLTAQSAVLTEKLGDLYQMEGETNFAIKSWQQALRLNPTPLQAVRLTLVLGDNLIASGKEDEALTLYDDFLKGSPSYPDALALYQKMEPLAKQLHKRSQAKRYAKEIARLTSAPAKQGQ
jgi:tetratricopeptide (TPR) repeat protein